MLRTRGIGAVLGARSLFSLSDLGRTHHTPTVTDPFQRSQIRGETVKTAQTRAKGDVI